MMEKAYRAVGRQPEELCLFHPFWKATCLFVHFLSALHHFNQDSVWYSGCENSLRQGLWSDSHFDMGHDSQSTDVDSEGL